LAATGLAVLAATAIGAWPLSAFEPSTGEGAAHPRCGGKRATMVGTDGDDLLRGTRARDVISAEAGNDMVITGASRDLVCAGPGDDSVRGLAGPDRLSGGTGADTLQGGAGTDALRGGKGSDTLFGGPGSDLAFGKAGDDAIFGHEGNDRLRGGARADRVRGGRGNDRLTGGRGRDVVDGDFGDDRVNGGRGDGDDVAGDLGIDIVNGGPGDGDLVHGDYGFDLMVGGGGQGDVASFAQARSGKGGFGVRVSLAAARASGDGQDRLRRFEDIEGSAFDDTLIGNRRSNRIYGGPGDDRLRGGAGRDTADGGPGSDRCRGFGGRRSCGRQRRRGGTVARVVPSPGGGAGLAIVAGRRKDRLTVSFDPASLTFTIESATTLRPGDACARSAGGPGVTCQAPSLLRYAIIDLGAGNDRLRVGTGLTHLGAVRVNGGPGIDVVRGGPEEDLVEGGTGADRLFGGGGSDALVGGPPGGDFIVGGREGDLLAAGHGCGGGRLTGGPGRDNASFAETPAHPGVLVASLARGRAFITTMRRCKPVRIARSAEDLEGSFDWDVLIGDSRRNTIFGQPGLDRFYGRGGADVIDARDRERDAVLNCGRGGRDAVFRDRHDPPPLSC
jgi:Ca2+-binding RTX toxin-like protein